MQRGETELRTPSCLLFFSFLEVTPSVLCEFPAAFPSVQYNPFFFYNQFCSVSSCFWSLPSLSHSSTADEKMSWPSLNPREVDDNAIALST